MNVRYLARSGRPSVTLKKNRSAETVGADLWRASAARRQMQSKAAHVLRLGRADDLVGHRDAFG